MIVAWLALLSWPFLTIVFFATMTVPAALSTAIIGGYLMLPEIVEYKVPGLPAFDKYTITVLSAFFCVLAVRKPEGPKGLLPRSGWGITLLLVLVFGLVGTHWTNQDSFFFGDWFLRSVPLSDIPVAMIELFVVLLPFFLGRRYLATEAAQKTALQVLVGFGVFYSFLALFEVRMSPQLNNWLYGFFPHSFSQHIRGGGYRPLVFLPHGLWLAIFLSMSTLAALGLSSTKSSKQERIIYGLVAVWLYGVLFLSKSLGAFAITTVLGAMWLFLPKRALRLGLVAVLIVVLAYPMLRSLGWIPVDRVLALAEMIDASRADSLAFRINNEVAMLEHARERPIFGWGAFGRNLATDALERSGVVPDGYWVIAIGKGGYVRYFAEFGLLVLGALMLLLSSRKRLGTVGLTVACLVAANMTDLLPNATLTTLTWLLAGAMAGRWELGATAEAATQTPTQPEGPRQARFSRPAYGDAPYRRDLTKEVKRQ